MRYLGTILTIAFTVAVSQLMAQGLVFQGDGGSSVSTDQGATFGSGLQALQDRVPLLAPKTIVELTRQRDGHFYADLTVNGKIIRFLVDTGATHIVLSKEDARNIGIRTANLNFSGRAHTANGVVETASVTLRSIALGKVIKYDFPATIPDASVSGSLLGMQFLSTFSQIDIRDDKMFLHF